jgi:uncharacterized protein
VTDLPSEPRRSLPGFVLAIIYVALSGLWVIVFNVAAAGLIAVVVLARDGSDGYDSLQQVLTQPLVMGVTAALQTGGLLALAIGLLAVSRRDLVQGLALRRVGLVGLAGSLVIGLVAGFWAGWVAELLPRLAPALDSDIFDVLAEAMTEGPLASRLLFYAVIVLVAPVAEELIFRGFLWDVLEDSWGPWAAWGLTSLAFAGYHLVPLHVIAILSTGWLIGWLRLATGSIWPCIFAHFLNNLLSVVLLLALGDSEWTPGWIVAVAALVTCVLTGVAVSVLGRSGAARGLVRSAPPREEEA